MLISFEIGYSKAGLRELRRVVISLTLALTLATSLGARSIFIGDLHGDLQAAITILFHLGIIDEDGHWKEGNTDRVFWAGDVVGKGPHSFALLLLAKDLQSEARAQGGDFEIVLGNGEIALFEGKFDNLSDYDKRLFLTEIEEGVDPMTIKEKKIDKELERVFSSDAELIQWLAERPTVHYDSESQSLVLHAALGRSFSKLSPFEINALAHSLIQKLRKGQKLSSSEKKLLEDFSPWNFVAPHRIQGRKDRKAESEALKKSEYNAYLRRHQARRMIGGHVRTKRYEFRIVESPYYGKKLVRIDSSISSSYDQGQLSAFVIENGRATKIYLDGRLTENPGFMSLILRCNERLRSTMKSEVISD